MHIHAPEMHIAVHHMFVQTQAKWCELDKHVCLVFYLVQNKITLNTELLLELLWTKSHRAGCPLSITGDVSHMAQAHNIQCIWRVQRWNPDSALFTSPCLIFQMPQSHIVGQRAGLAAECRTLSCWDLSNDWHPKAACCSVPRKPRADRSQL